MEAIAALGLVSNIIQLIDFTAKLVSQSTDFLQSAGNTIPENFKIASLAEENKTQLEKILSEAKLRKGPLISEEAALQSAAKNCSDRADDLLLFLKKFEVKTRNDGTTSKSAKVLKVLKGYLKRDEVKARQSNLEQAQTQLNTALLQFIRLNQDSGFEELRNQLTGVSSTLTLLASRSAIEKTIAQQTDGLNSLLWTLHDKHDLHYIAQDETLRQMNVLNSNINTDIEQRKADRLLNTLKFPDMDARMDMIHEATSHTFEWLLKAGDEDSEDGSADGIGDESSQDTEDSDSYELSSDHESEDRSDRESESTSVDVISGLNVFGEDNPLRENARRTFQHWLSSGTGVFWLTGKAGSGKSTLIKFLQHHKRTHHLLTKWANDHALIVASHFFWHSGSRMQKSHDGLLRCLLHQVLVTNQNLISLAFPDLWKGEDIPHMIRWSRRDLMQGLHNLRNVPIYICLFIDGLDEYNPHSDHDELIKDIFKISKSYNIKLCVSSRPWQIFEDSFRGHETIKLEDLNEEDIKQNLWNKLGRAATDSKTRKLFRRRSKDAVQLVEKITKKSSGVFLWAHLVANRLSDWLRIGKTLESLDNYVDEFPADLEGYLRDLILERISTTWKGSSATAQALKLTMLAHSTQTIFEIPHQTTDISNESIRLDRTPLIFYWFLTVPEGLTEPRFGEAMPVADLSIQDIKTKLILTRNFLKATCGDLLSIPDDIQELDISQLDRWTTYGAVDFFHRSVFDFLMSSEDMQTLIDEHVPQHFGTESFHAQLQLSAAKIILPYFMHRQEYLKRWNIFKDSSEYFKNGHIVKTSGTAFGEVIWRDTGFLASALQIATEIPDHRLVEACESVAIEYVERYIGYPGIDGFWLPECLASNARTLGPFFISQHFHGFTEAKIRRGLEVTLDELRSALGMSSMGTLFNPEGFPLTEVNRNFVRLLLQNGVNSNDYCHIFGYDSRSLWHRFLGKWMQEACTYTPPSAAQDNVSLEAFTLPFKHSLTESLKIWKLAELLLEHGANVSSDICVLDHRCESDGICHVAKVSGILGLLVPAPHLSELGGLLEKRGAPFEPGLPCKVNSCKVRNWYDIRAGVFHRLERLNMSSYLIYRDADLVANTE